MRLGEVLLEIREEMVCSCWCDASGVKRSDCGIGLRCVAVLWEGSLSLYIQPKAASRTGYRKISLLRIYIPSFNLVTRSNHVSISGFPFESKVGRLQRSYLLIQNHAPVP